VNSTGKALAIATVRPDLSEVEYYVVFDSLSDLQLLRIFIPENLVLAAECD
jgi:hypothetical protein